MDLKIEQRVIIKFLIDLGEKLANIFLKLKKVFRNECALRTRLFEWARRFKDGRRSVYDDERLGAPLRMQGSQMKAMLICFLDVHGIVHHEFVPLHQTITAKFYLEVLGHLRARITQVSIMTMHWYIHLPQYANIWWKKNSHVAKFTLPPDLVACDFFLFIQTQVGAERDAIR